jgi:UDPglucose 6-dehydrogenase
MRAPCHNHNAVQSGHLSDPGRWQPVIDFAEGPYDCVEGADALVIVTEWEQFRALNFERLGSVMNQRVLIDLRNVYRPQEIEGFTFHGVGQSSVQPGS